MVLPSATNIQLWIAASFPHNYSRGMPEEEFESKTILQLPV